MTTKWQELEKGKNFKLLAKRILGEDLNRYMTKIETYLNLLSCADNSPEEAGEYFEKIHELEDKIKTVNSFISKFEQTSDWNASQLIKMETTSVNKGFNLM